MGLKWIFIREQLRDLQTHLFSERVFNGAATLAYYLTLSLFPGLIFLFTLAPYLPLPDVQGLIARDFFSYLPPTASAAVLTTVTDIIQQPRAGLLSLSFIFALVAASSGTAAIMRQMNIAYNIRERRPYLRMKLTALGLTLLLLVVLLAALALIVVGGQLEKFLVTHFQMTAFFGFMFTVFRWTTVIVMVFVALSILYYYGPDTRVLSENYRFVSGGGVLATLLIVIFTALFSVYAANFAHYNKLYGSLAGVMILMIWFYLIGVSILMGAELNNLIREKRIFLKILKHIK